MDDLRFMVIAGRKWRRTDPNIPDSLRSELVAELMSARRAVRAALGGGSADCEAKARMRVQDAKVALGERGTPWWARTHDGDWNRSAPVIRTLLGHRGPESSICPSDVARVIGGQDWRKAMALVREVVQEMEDDAAIVVTQKGEPATRPWRGPLRLRLPR